MSFGDFNNDTYTDLITLNSDGTQMYLYIWNKNSYSFDQNTVIDKIDPEIVLNVMPADFDYDGKLDLLLIT